MYKMINSLHSGEDEVYLREARVGEWYKDEDDDVGIVQELDEGGKVFVWFGDNSVNIMEDDEYLLYPFNGNIEVKIGG